MREKIILVIDDDEMNLQIAKMILEKKLSCKVLCAKSGIEGLEILKKRRVNLVLLDIMMPDFDGLDTLKEIRNNEKIKDVPVIMLTATSDIETVQQTSALGVKDYIRKPFLPKKLIERVEKKLAQEHSEEILIFGDDEDELQNMKNIIEENFSHEVLIATSINDAEKILREQKINLILSCANMKFINGFKLLKLLAADEKFNEIPFALTTPDKISELLKNLNQSKFTEEIIHNDKKKIANVVTSLIGYRLS